MGEGAGIGAVVGALGNALQAYEAKKQAASLRKAIRGGIHAGEYDTFQQIRGVLGSQENRAGLNFVRGIFGMGATADADINTQLVGSYGDQRAQEIMLQYGNNTPGRPEGLPASERARFAENAKIFQSIHERTHPLSESYGSGDALTQDFIKGIRQAQSVRGLYSSEAGAAAEASGLAAFRANLQMQLLPQLLGFGSQAVDLQQRLEGGNIAKRVFESTGGKAAYGQATPLAQGPSVLGAALSGAAQGAGAGASLQTNYQTSQMGGYGGGQGGAGFGGYNQGELLAMLTRNNGAYSGSYGGGPFASIG